MTSSAIDEAAGYTATHSVGRVGATVTATPARRSWLTAVKLSLARRLSVQPAAEGGRGADGGRCSSPAGTATNGPARAREPVGRHRRAAGTNTRQTTRNHTCTNDRYSGTVALKFYQFVFTINLFQFEWEYE